MLVWTTVRLALKSLAANKLRSILAMLGIIIAVWAVISALALGAGAQAGVVKRMTALGTNLLVIRPEQKQSGGAMTGRWQNLKEDDAVALTAIDGVDRVAPVARGNGQLKFFNRNTNTSILGSSATYFGVRDYEMQYGRAITDGDCEANARVGVLGPATAAALFGPDYSWCVGQSIQVKGVSYVVVGVTLAKGDQGWSNPDDQIIVPYTTAMKQILGVDYLGEIDVKCRDGADLDKVQADVQALMRERHRVRPDAPDDVSVFNQAQMISTMTEITQVLTILLGGIAGIALLVGGIGIMNIMLVTVAERTREIGIRKAIGAKERDILRQFLIESVVMSVLGGAIGVAVALVTAQAISAAQERFQLLVQDYSIVLALGFSLCVGIFFGYYPARRAAKLDPIEALRYE